MQPGVLYARASLLTFERVERAEVKSRQARQFQSAKSQLAKINIDVDVFLAIHGETVVRNLSRI